MSKTFCPIPWNSISIVNNGDFRVCCNADYKDRIGTLLKDKNNKKLNASDDDWSEVRNSPLMKDVRKKMLNGEWHSECERCRQEELSGLKSHRQKQVLDWSKWFGNFIDVDKAKKVTSNDGTLDTENQKIDHIDMRYGNFCNLKCRMCGPHDSHMWNDDYEKLYGKTEFKTHDWFVGSQGYLDNFEKYGFNAHQIYSAGGEPLIIEEHKESLRSLVKNNKAKNIRLEYNTNLTTIPDEVFELWKNFKEIRIAASIDGFGKVFNYQRSPANFDKVYKNMVKLDQAEDMNIRLWFHPTVTVFNIFHMPEFIKWKLVDSGLKNWNRINSPSPIVSYHMCHTPKYYCVRLLPQHLKDKVKKHYDTYIDWVHTTDLPDHVKTEFVKKCKGIVSYMYNEDYTDQLDKFVSITKRLDEIRKQNILDIVPEYAELFSK